MKMNYQNSDQKGFIERFFLIFMKLLLSNNDLRKGSVIKLGAIHCSKLDDVTLTLVPV